MGHRVTAAVAACTALAMMAIADPSDAHAGALCEHRSAAHVAEHGGIPADNAWHLANGDLPTCDGQEQSRYNDEGPGDENTRRGGGSDDKDKKSRFCRTHWYC